MASHNFQARPGDKNVGKSLSVFSLWDWCPNNMNVCLHFHKSHLINCHKRRCRRYTTIKRQQLIKVEKQTYLTNRNWTTWSKERRVFCQGILSFFFCFNVLSSKLQRTYAQKATFPLNAMNSNVSGWDRVGRPAVDRLSHTSFTWCPPPKTMNRQTIQLLHLSQGKSFTKGNKPSWTT